MFDQLATTAPIQNDDDFRKLRSSVRLAALMHDCGHGAFSHLSENALSKVSFLCSAFKQLHETLDEFFSDSVREKIKKTTGMIKPIRKHHHRREQPPIAELLSALMVLSPQLEQFLRDTEISQDHILRTTSLIIGKPYGLTSTDGRNYYDFVKSLISGDLDADKIDYVARDAYFAGIPIAADVERLISQLDTIYSKLDIDDSRIPNSCYILGILHSGVSAVEMFILTRAYLFDRVYQHPKIRSAERLLERAMISNIANTENFEKNNTNDIKSEMDRFYDLTGDDGYLYAYSGIESDNKDANLINAILTRKLPQRIVALSQRFVFGYDENSGAASTLLTRAWDDASKILSQSTEILELEISKLLPEESQVIIDWPRHAPLKENPEIYVSDRNMPDKLVTINQYFDAAQLSKAYEDVKKHIWIFSTTGERAHVAVAAAIVLCAQFGIVPRDEGLTKAKIKSREFESALLEFRAKKQKEGDFGSVTVADEVQRVKGNKLRFPWRMLEGYLPLGDKNDTVEAAVMIAEELEKTHLTPGHLQDVEASLPVLQVLLKHSLFSAEVGKRHELSLDEKEFQKDVHAFAVQELGPDNSPILTLNR